MMKARHRLTLIDLMATVVTAALTMGVYVFWGGDPPHLPALVVMILLGVPLVGIVWDRWRGHSGILGGVLGGAAVTVVAVVWMLTDPHKPGGLGPADVANYPIVVVLMFAGYTTLGTLLGIVTWLVAAAMGQSNASKIASPSGQLVRQR